MKILIFNNAGLVSNSGDYCIENNTGMFAEELKELGNEITFFGQFIPDIKNTTDTFPILQNGMNAKGIHRNGNKLFYYIKLYLKAIPEIYKCDFAYFFYPTSLRFLIFFAILFNKKYGLYIRGIDDLKKTESKFFYKKAFAIFTVADFFTDYVKKINSVVKVSTIRPMILFNENDIIKDKNDNEIGKSLNILYLGRMTNDKGIIELMHAIKVLVKEKTEPNLMLVGSGEYFDELEKIAKELDIQKYVHFKGSVSKKDEIKKFYLDADVFILPTYHEGFPRTLYEAMIFRTPIITTFVGGISGIMKDKVNCLQIQPKSVTDIVESLSYASQNYSEMIRFAENGTKTIAEILSSRKDTHAQMLDQELKNLRL